MEKLEIQDEELRDPIPGEYGHPIPREILFRELGFSEPYSRHLIGRRVTSATLATKAVHTLCTKETINRRKFKLPTGARTTFHMAFSADGTKLASCHGDHNVYVCDVRNGEVLQTLSGHPRTPWCVVFHPTQNDVLASGCLAGHVRVWDLNGGSEVLVTDSGTVIASLAFHPTVRLLAIATFNEIIFWDWGLPHPLARCSTENTKEKVRLVRFDRLGKSLITGITNFPNPPVREAFQATSNHRPNILSRGNARPNSVNFYIHERPDGDNRDVPVDVADDQVDRSNDANSREMAEFAESFAAAAEAEAASAVLNRRQDRFQESYRQLVNHYQDLVTHYQQFLRSRIPRLLETSRIVREQPIIPVQNPQAPSAVEPEAESQHNSNPAPAPATTSNVGESSSTDEELPGPSRLMQLEARLLEIINTPESSDSTSQSSSASTTEGSSIPTRLRNDTDLRNIEMLAQNILEMQNLCSQARRDAPLTIETQHIIELQNIRRHLELLQEQTRELQSSIRATLTSLARGSLDALRSHVTNTSTTGSLAASYTRGSLDALRSHVTNGNNSSYPHFGSNINPTPGSPSSNHSYSRAFVTGSTNQSATGNPSNAILRITIGPRLTASAELIPPATSTGGTAPSNGPTRTQVPPAITMQYELPDSSFRNTNSSAAAADANEPVAGTSRGSGRNTGEANLTSGPRRILREFQLITGRGSDMEQHARNCPFSGRDQPQRPPPRMRCLAEMGEVPTLTVWPTIETGIELETRNFREIRRENTRIENRTVAYVQEPRIILDPLVSHLGGSGYNSGNPGNSAVSSYFNQWYVGGPNWISNDVGVHVFLTIRRVADNVRRSSSSVVSEDLEAFEGENWQRLFPCGFAFIHPWARQGHRPDRRAHRREIRRGIFPCGSPRSRSDSNYSGFGRYGLWDDTARPASNSQAATPSSSTSNASTAETSQPTRNTGRQLPPRINGNLILIYYMRAGEEIIPVYSFSPENHDPNETPSFREGPLPHVFVFPIGLFLRGNAWENGTQTLGVYWPPVSRDEEQNLNEFRRSDALLPIFPTRTRASTSVQRSESYNNTRYRVTYNSEQTEIFLPRGGSIVMIQPGLLLLDAITSFAYFDRPRPAQGVLFFDYVSPFLEALETLFGFRQRNSVLSGSSVSSVPSPSRASMHPGWVRPPNMPARWVNMNTNSQNQRQFLEATEPAVIRQEVNGMLVRRNIDPAFAAMYSHGQDVRGGLERIDRVLADRTRRLDDEEVGRASGNNSASGTSRSGRWQASRDNDSPETNEGVNSARRVIRLAVDTATADILRRDQQNARGHITRAIESRIERVLNERGNRGITEYPPSYINSTVYLPVNAVNWNNNPAPENNEVYSPDRQLRLDDIQLRISMLAQWSQQTRAGGPNSVTSGTQTSASFLRSSTQGSSSTSQGGSSSQPSENVNASARASGDSSNGGVRANRRRPYPEEQSSTSTPSASTASPPLDDDVLPSPSRIPRLTAYRDDDSVERQGMEDENLIDFRERDWSLPSTSSTDTSREMPVIAGTSSASFDYPFDRRMASRNPSSTVAGRVGGFPYSRPGNPVVQTMEVDDDEDDDEDDEPPPLVRIVTTPPPPSTSQTPEQGSVEVSRERSTTPLSEEERVFEELIRDTATDVQNNVQTGGNANDGSRRQETNELERTFSRLISSLDRMPTSEPLLLRLRDVITPVGVSPSENVRRSGIPRVELNSPEMDEIDGERESQLLIGSFENSPIPIVGHNRNEWPPTDASRMGPRLQDSALDLENRNILIESAENPLLQTVGEATAREAIASIGLMSRVSPTLSNPVIGDVEGAVPNENVAVIEDTIPHVATIPYPYPFHGMNNEDNQRNRDSAFLGPIQELMERETPRSAVSNSRETAASMNPLLRTIDEATARNAINSALSYPIESSLDSLQEPILQVESPAYPYQLYSRQNETPTNGNAPARPADSGSRSARARTTPLSTQLGEWLLRRQRSSTSHSRVRVTVRSSEANSNSSNTGSQELSGSARTRLGLSSGTGNSLSARFTATRNANPGTASGSAGPSTGDQRHRPTSSGYVPLPHPYVYRHPHHHFHVHHSAASNNNNPGDEPGLPQDSGARFYPGYIPEILITPRARPPTYYTMDAATTAFLSSRIQKWDFSNFYIPDITDRTSGLITASCSLHSDATLDVSSDSEFIAVLQPSDNGSYSAVGIYSLRDETLGESLYTYHFDQNTVSVSISPSCDYIVVGYAGRGPFYRIVHPSRNIGQILSLTREGQHVKLVPVKELFADTQPTLMSINCMHWVPIPGYGIIYGTNTGEVVLLS